ncbi:MAG: hypothetical protein U9N45_01420, partial [Gemmatimonadota bacterium]|nr:hypothetical protein [Gemmatimonadota bacterium]
MSPCSEKQHLDTAKETKRIQSLLDRCHEALRERKPLDQALSAEELGFLRSRYSNFKDRLDSEGFLVDSAHVVTRVDTPRPYIHFMNSNHSREFGIYGSLWDISGSGFSCLDSVLGGQVTSHKDNSYVPTAPKPSDHRSFILREQAGRGKAEIWHMIPQRGRDEEAYDTFRCEQGLGSVRTFSRRNGLLCELLVFVPVDDPIEVWRLKVVNESGKKRSLSLFVSVNWGLESYPSHYFDPR